MLLKRVLTCLGLVFSLFLTSHAFAADKTVSADETWTGNSTFDNLIVDTNATLTIAAGAKLAIIGNVTLGSTAPDPNTAGSIIVADSSSIFSCPGTLEAKWGNCSLSVPANYFNGPAFSDITIGASATLDYSPRPLYEVRATATVDSNSDIVVSAFLTQDGDLIDSGLVLGNLTTISCTPAEVQDSTAYSSGIFSVTFDSVAQADTNYSVTIGITAPDGIEYKTIASVVTPASGGTTYEAHSNVWWDETTDQLKVRGWLTADNQLLTANITSQVVEINGTQRGTPTTTGGIVEEDYDISEAYLSRDTTYVVEVQIEYNSTTFYYSTQSIHIPSEPAVAYEANLEAVYDGASGISLRASLQGNGSLITGLAAGDCVFSVSSFGTNPTVSESNGIFSATQAGVDADTVYVVQVTITAPDGADYTDMTTLHIPVSTTTSYETQLSVVAGDSNTLYITTYLTANGEIDSSVVVGTDVTLTVGGSAIASGDITNTSGRLTATFAATADTSYEVISVITAADTNDYTAAANVYVPSSQSNTLVAHAELIYNSADTEIEIKVWLTNNGDLDTTIPLGQFGISPSGPTIPTSSAGGSAAAGIYSITYDGNIDTAATYYFLVSIFSGGVIYDEIVSVYTASSSVDVAALESKIDDIDDKLGVSGSDTIVGAITAETDLIKADTEQTQYFVESGILNRETSIRTGTSITIRYRTASGLSPVYNIYSPSDVLLVTNTAMTEVGSTGVYHASVTFSQSWSTGEFTVVCSESTRSTQDALVISVVPFDISTVSSDIEQLSSDISNVNSGVGDVEESIERVVVITDTIDSINNRFSELQSEISGMTEDIVLQANQSADIKTNLNEMYESLVMMSEEIKKMGAADKANLESMIEVVEGKKDDIIYLKNKAEELKAAMDISQKLIDDVANEPVVQVWYEFR